MIKVISPALRNPSFQSLEAFHRYWAESHGPLYAQLRSLRRYVQHLTLPEAYGIEPAPTFDGASIFWYDSLDALSPDAMEELLPLRQAATRDGRYLFDYEPRWPRHNQRARVIAEEHVILDGRTRPEMVKLMSIVSRVPGLTHKEFFDRWEERHGMLVTRIPGVRRYVQNHAIVEALPDHPMTHDGWSEVWYDDLASIHRATLTREWQALREDGVTLVMPGRGVVVARERIQKDFDVPLPEPKAASMTEDEIRECLRDQGYRTLAEDPDAPGKILRAAQSGALGIWTDEHILTVDESAIDARPER